MSRIVLCGLLLALLLQFHPANGQTGVVVAVVPEEIQTVIEGDTFMTCFGVTLPEIAPSTDIILDIVLAPNVTDIGMVNEQLTFPPDMMVAPQCINTTVPIDDVLEPMESFQGVFQVTVNVGGTSSILLLGNLVIENAGVAFPIGFELPSYTFIEGSASNQVCVTVDGTIDGSTIFLQATLMSETGINSAGPGDFVNTPLPAFSENTMNMMECITVNINNDTNFEMTETFSFELTTAVFPLSIDPSRNSTTIVIFDVDANCGDPPTGPGLNVPATSGPIIDSPSGTIANLGAMATYTCMNPALVVLGSDVLTCMDVGGMVADWSPALPTCVPELDIGFELPSYIFVEGTSNEVCVTVDGIVEGSSVFTATLGSIPETASAADFVISMLPGFDAGTMNMMECITVTVSNDTDLESVETFTIQLTMANIPLNIDPSRNTATITIFDVDANCGDPPTSPNLTVTTSEQFMDSSAGGTITNLGAMATYMCIDSSLVLEGPNLVCTAVGNMTAEWIPDLPNCVPGPIIITTVDGDDSNTGRNIGIGVGVGVGGALLILLIVLVIVLLCFCYRRGKRHSKYVLNYNTVYGTDQRPAKREIATTTTESTGLTPADDPNVGENVADDEGVEVAAV